LEGYLLFIIPYRKICAFLINLTVLVYPREFSQIATHYVSVHGFIFVPSLHSLAINLAVPKEALKEKATIPSSST